MIVFLGTVLDIICLFPNIYKVSKFFLVTMVDDRLLGTFFAVLYFFLSKCFLMMMVDDRFLATFFAYVLFLFIQVFFGTMVGGCFYEQLSPHSIYLSKCFRDIICSRGCTTSTDSKSSSYKNSPRRN